MRMSQHHRRSASKTAKTPKRRSSVKPSDVVAPLGTDFRVDSCPRPFLQLLARFYADASLLAAQSVPLATISPQQASTQFSMPLGLPLCPRKKTGPNTNNTRRPAKRVASGKEDKVVPRTAKQKLRVDKRKLAACVGALRRDAAQAAQWLGRAGDATDVFFPPFCGGDTPPVTPRVSVLVNRVSRSAAAGKTTPANAPCVSAKTERKPNDLPSQSVMDLTEEAKPIPNTKEGARMTYRKFRNNRRKNAKRAFYASKTTERTAEQLRDASEGQKEESHDDTGSGLDFFECAQKRVSKTPLHRPVLVGPSPLLPSSRTRSMAGTASPGGHLRTIAPGGATFSSSSPNAGPLLAATTTSAQAGEGVGGAPSSLVLPPAMVHDGSVNENPKALLASNGGRVENATQQDTLSLTGERRQLRRHVGMRLSAAYGSLLLKLARLRRFRPKKKNGKQASRTSVVAGTGSSVPNDADDPAVQQRCESDERTGGLRDYGDSSRMLPTDSLLDLAKLHKHFCQRCGCCLVDSRTSSFHAIVLPTDSSLLTCSTSVGGLRRYRRCWNCIALGGAAKNGRALQALLRWSAKQRPFRRTPTVAASSVRTNSSNVQRWGGVKASRRRARKAQRLLAVACGMAQLQRWRRSIVADDGRKHNSSQRPAVAVPGVVVAGGHCITSVDATGSQQLLPIEVRSAATEPQGPLRKKRRLEAPAGPRGATVPAPPKTTTLRPSNPKAYPPACSPKQPPETTRSVGAAVRRSRAPVLARLQRSAKRCGPSIPMPAVAAISEPTSSAASSRRQTLRPQQGQLGPAGPRRHEVASLISSADALKMLGL